MATETTALRITRIRASNRVGGMTFLPSGQQYSGMLPAGDYRIIGECFVDYTDFGKPARANAIKLQRIIGGEHWYIGKCVADSLPIVLGDYDMVPIGSRWKTDVGTVWEAMERRGEFVRVERLGPNNRRTGDFYDWHISSLTETTARRIK